jgi:hypothetical protein
MAFLNPYQAEQPGRGRPRMIRRGNSRVRLVRRKSKADPWTVYDALPAPIRAVLQEGPAELCPLAARRTLRRLRRLDDIDEGGPDASAIASTVFILERAHKWNILRASDWQPPGRGRRKPLPSPHILARATMQSSGRPPQ